MKKRIETTYTINASGDKVWANISKAEGVNTWLPVITTCRLEGAGEGAKRVCTTEQGTMYETILKIDTENKLFQYSIDEQPLLPIENVIGTMVVTEKDGKTVLKWSLDFTLQDESLFTMVKQVIEGMYLAGAKGLESISV